MPALLTGSEHGHDALDVLRRQPVVVRHLDALAGSVDKQRLVVHFVSLQNHDADGDARPKKQVRRKRGHTGGKVNVLRIFFFVSEGRTFTLYWGAGMDIFFGTSIVIY